MRGIFGAGSIVIECKEDMLQWLGHNTPPVEG